MDGIKSSVFRPTEVEEDTHPHACTNGLVFLTYTAFDEEVGEEVEKVEAIPCRRCAEEGGGYVEDWGSEAGCVVGRGSRGLRPLIML